MDVLIALIFFFCMAGFVILVGWVSSLWAERYLHIDDEDIDDIIEKLQRGEPLEGGGDSDKPLQFDMEPVDEKARGNHSRANGNRGGITDDQR